MREHGIDSLDRATHRDKSNKSMFGEGQIA